MSTALHTKIHELAAPLAASLGLDIWGMELLPGSRITVRLYVDTPQASLASGAANMPDTTDTADTAGTAHESDATAAAEEYISPEHVSIDQCAHLSRRLGLALEVEDIFPDAYVLEISSPGLERPFFTCAQLKPYIGRDITCTLTQPVEAAPNRRNFTGTLTGVDDDAFTLSLDDNAQSVTLAWKLVKKARLIHIYPDELKAKPKGGSGRKKGATKNVKPETGDGGSA